MVGIAPRATPRVMVEGVTEVEPDRVMVVLPVEGGLYAWAGGPEVVDVIGALVEVPPAGAPEPGDVDSDSAPYWL